MICLHCNHDNPYGLDDCAGCGRSFAVRPPFIEQNHVSQLMAALIEFQQQEIDRNTFLQRFDRFLAIYAELDSAWQFDAPLSERLSENLLNEDGVPINMEVWEGLQTIDAGLELMREALSRLQALRNPSNRPPGSAETTLLGEAHGQLLDAFRAICSGSAALLHCLELWQPPSAVADYRKPGSLINFSSPLV